MKNSHSENHAKEDEMRELTNRVEELETEAENQRKNQVTEDAARNASTQVQIKGQVSLG